MRSRASAADGTDDRSEGLARRRLDALIAELVESRDPAAGAAPEAVVAPAAVAAPVAPVAPVASDGTGGRHARRPLTASRRMTGWVADRLPPTLQGRVHLGAAQFGLVALVVAVGLVVGAWWLVRAGGSAASADGDVVPPRPVSSAVSAPSSGEGVPLPAGGTTTAGAGAAPVAGAGQDIVVDVVGKVRRPGIAVLPAGSRVVDAVRAAGGMRPGVDRATVNLARPLTDGEQVLIGVAGAPATSTATGSAGDPAGALVNLNTADQAELETLPGVGPVTAAAILEWRAEHGGFSSVDELLEVSGIGEATLAQIAPHVTL